METQEDLFLKAYNLYNTGDFRGAQKLYDKILLVDIGNIKAMIGKSLCLFYGSEKINDSDYEPALKIYRNAVNLSGRNINILLDLGELLNKSGANRLFKEAITIFDEVLSKETQNFKALAGKCYSFYRLSRFKDCIDLSAKLLKLEPANADVWFYKAWSEFNTDLYRDALESFNNAVKLKPTEEIYWCYRALVLNKLKRYSEAIESADQAIKINPQYTTALLYKCDSLNALGQHKEAEKISKQIPYEPVDNM